MAGKVAATVTYKGVFYEIKPDVVAIKGKKIVLSGTILDQDAV